MYGDCYYPQHSTKNAYSSATGVYTVALGTNHSSFLEDKFKSWSSPPIGFRNTTYYHKVGYDDAAISSAANEIGTQICGSKGFNDDTPFYFTTSRASVPQPNMTNPQSCDADPPACTGPVPGTMTGKFFPISTGDCGCKTPTIGRPASCTVHGECGVVYISYDRDIALSNTPGKFTIRDETNNLEVLSYDLGSTDSQFLSFRPSTEPCPQHTCSASSSGSHAFFEIPTSLLTGVTQYSASISDGWAVNPYSVADYAPGFTWIFTTPDVTPPRIISQNPPPGATGVAVAQTNFEIYFNEGVTVVEGRAHIKDTAGNTHSYLSANTTTGPSVLSTIGIPPNRNPNPNPNSKPNLQFY